ncbi:MAG TPA: hypothetical protein VNO21_23060 [Polyangiaceae bacterium]|nr:hypothetical protein [Polyangiaceae bacterium]
MLLRVTIVAVMGVVGVACGGSTDTLIGDAGTTHDGAANDAGNCEQLAADISNLRSQAMACCDTCKSLQCAKFVDDLCCPLSVNAPDSEPVLAFEKAVKAFGDASCRVECPARPCRSAPSSICNPSVSGSDPTGRCQQ